MRSLPFTTSVSIVLAAALISPPLSQAQFSISTVAGGGPNNLTATNASIGYAGGVVRDSAGNTYITDSYSSQVFKVDTSGNLTVFAGNGSVGYTGDGGPATAASLSGPEAVAVDGSGNVFIADTANSVIREVVASSGVIQTVAGNGQNGYSGDGGPATSAELADPFGVFVDGSGNIFIADTDNFIVREVTASNGNIQTVAGTPGTSGYAGDNGPATSAQLDQPEGVFVDGSGDIFIADTDNSVIREVTAGTITTVAGDGTAGYSGDTGPATSAELNLPNGVFVDGSGDIFIADTQNSVIREVVATVINTVAGDGTAGYAGDGGPATSAELNLPSTMFVDGSGNIFIADTDNYLIREVTSENISSIAGNNTQAYSGDGGVATNAALNFPGETFVDASGDIFIADTDNSVIREVVASSGNIQTVAGNGISGYSGDGAPATSAELNLAQGVFVDGSGNIFIADTENAVIREVVAATGDIETVAGDGLPCTTVSQYGDGGPATSAGLSGPYGVAVDSSGNIYIADTGDAAIRVVNTGSQAITIAGVTIQPGTIQTVAGTPLTTCSDNSPNCGDNGPATSADLNFPTGLALDAAGDIFIADAFDDAVREVNASTGTIQTVAGMIGQRGYSGDNGSPTSATLDTPYGLYVDSFGNIFIADTDNSAIREVVAVASTIQTIAGNGTEGFSGDGGNGTNAELAHPTGVFGTAAGNFYVADTANLRIRELISGVNVNVEPSTIDVTTTAPQPFAALVSGTSNSAVTWQVNGVTGGNSSIGTISNTGIYTAPTNVPSHPAVTVGAVSNANGFTSGKAEVTIVGGTAPNVTITTKPGGVTEVYTGTTQTFNVTVTGETNTAVNWAVNGVAGGNGTVGTISSSGLYTAPSTVPSQPVVMLTAVSQANSALSGAYPFTIVTVPSGPEPASQTISPGQAATYSLSLNANTGSPSQPITLACATGSLPPGASCSFSPAKITPSNKAVPFTLTVNVPTGTTASLTPEKLWLASQICFGFMPLTGILLIGGSRRKLRGRWLWLVVACVLLSVLVGCGGGGGSTSTTTTNPEVGTYTIQIQGTTAAQPNAVTITTAGLTVK